MHYPQIHGSSMAEQGLCKAQVVGSNPTRGTKKEIKVSTVEFRPFGKIPRLSREVIVTEKIDGTNGSIVISPDGKTIQAGSRNRFITTDNDNFGFAKWVEKNKEELLTLGPGHHYGEWWGQGIQRGYELQERRFSLFNTIRWTVDKLPPCCNVVPVLYKGIFNTTDIDSVLWNLENNGSKAKPGFMKPEGIVIYHVAANVLFKKTLDKDDSCKGNSNENS